jgi:hypothetical protein
MRLTMKERFPVIREMSKTYKKASKKQRGRILSEFMELAGYTDRSHAALLLRCHGKRVRISPTLVVEGDARRKARRAYGKIYDKEIEELLKVIWAVMDYICGKRLAAVMGEVAPCLERHGEIELSAAAGEKLAKISAATIDRILKPARKALQLKGRSRTKPGTLLKHQIPIRTFAEWDEHRPGFVEIDLVAHDGGNASGEYMQSLDVTDVDTGWTEVCAVRNKAQVWVFEALTNIRKRMPFDLLGIDSDNGSEFINNHLLNYCKEEKITFTRARSYRKNDNCFVEQKNYSVVRRAVGYMRHDTADELALLNELYGVLRLYTNFFMPSMKLKGKTRDGAKISKKHDKPVTPYQRLLSSPDFPQERKDALTLQYENLNPAELKRKLDRMQRKLLRLAAAKNPPSEKQAETRKDNVCKTGTDKSGALAPLVVPELRGRIPDERATRVASHN